MPVSPAWVDMKSNWIKFASRYRQLIAVALFLVVVLAIAELSGLRGHFTLAFLHEKLVHNRVTGLAIFIALFTLGNLIQIPGWIFLASAVLALGRSWGGIATYVAATVSCGITFFTIHYVGGDALRRINNKFAIKLLDQLHAHPIRNVVLLRTLFQTLPALNYALALSGIGFRKYILGTMLGLPLPIAVYCLFFDYLGRAAHLS